MKTFKLTWKGESSIDIRWPPDSNRFYNSALSFLPSPTPISPPIARMPFLDFLKFSLLVFSHSVMSDFVTPWTAAPQTSLSFIISQSFLKFVSIELAMPSNHLILCWPLLLLPSIVSSIRGFSNESVLPIRLPKYWSCSFSISPSSEYSGLISFRMDWLDLLAVQGTLKSLLQHHSSKTSILQLSV